MEERPSGVHAIGDEQTVLGLALLGVTGDTVDSAADAREALDRALERDGLRLLLVTRSWIRAVEEELAELRRGSFPPVVLEIPGPEPGEAADSLRERVQAALGFQLGVSGPESE